jgi:hypothetical protein
MASPARRADIAFAVTVGLCLLALLASGVIGKRLEMIGHDDFSRIWAGPRKGGGADVGFALPLSIDLEDASAAS